MSLLPRALTAAALPLAAVLCWPGARAAAAAEPREGELSLPEVQFADLLEGATAASQAAREALTSLGAVAVTGVQHQRSPLGQHSRASLQAWASCLLPGGSARDGALLRPLPGGVLRASKVAGGAWDGPPQPWEPSQCPDTTRDTEAMRSGVRSATRALMAALDAVGRNRSGLAAAVLRHAADGAKTTASLADVVELGEHLEHLHVYQEGDEEEAAGGGAALDMHTDAGFLLAFVPPVSGIPGNHAAASAALQVTLPSGEVRPLAPPSSPDSVLFFIGESAKMLLSHKGAERLRPLPHALLLARGFGWRAWYGAMVLLPEDAVLRPDLHAGSGPGRIRRRPGDVATFGNWWEAAQSEALRDQQGHGHVGCGRALEAVDQTGACGAGKIACWHTCVPLDEGLQSCTGGQWVSKGLGDLAEFVRYSVQCREPSTGLAWPEETADHCETCLPQCTLSAEVSRSRASLATTGDFCIRTPTGEGTTMYMDGFKWTAASTEDTCLAFLFPTWVVDRWWKLILALFGVVAISTSVELVGLARRSLPPRRQHDVGLLLHVLSLTVAYVAMLFVMTYSLEMLLCVLLGLTTGHVLSKRWSPAGKRSEEGEGAGTPCCKLAQGIASSSGAADAGGAHWKVAAAGATENGPAQDIETIGSGDMTTMQLKVTGMTCSSCAKTVSNALAQVEGVFTANVDLQEQLASVVCRVPPTRVESLSAAVRDVGFEVASVSSSGGGANSLALKEGSARRRL